MKTFILSFLLFITTACYSQKEFFCSKQVFTADNMERFYSSISIHDSIVLFYANDYHLYAYNKNDGSLKWSYATNYKSSIPPFVAHDIVYAGIYRNEKEQAVQLELVSGKLIKTLPFAPLATKPFIKNGILYSTAIYDFGCIIAYDMSKDTVIWSRFIAHGYSRRPYYFDNKILANSESSNWVELGYDGGLLDTNCKKKAEMYVTNIPCIKTFAAVSHDGKEIKGKMASTIFGKEFPSEPEMLLTEKFTYVFDGTRLSILSGKLKIKQQVDIPSLAADLANDYNAKLVKADNENIWLLYSDHLLRYNHPTKKLDIIANLAKWNPRQLVMDDKNIWLVSGKDGLLYGLSL